jgi:CMP-2-keto-3-deoxyoctulosonic acid synthetase
MSRIALIPARRNSVRIAGKNWRDFRGRPIIEYSIDCAKRTGLFDQVWVSTDDNEIERILQANKVPYSLKDVKHRLAQYFMRRLVYNTPKDHAFASSEEVWCFICLSSLFYPTTWCFF